MNECWLSRCSTAWWSSSGLFQKALLRLRLICLFYSLKVPLKMKIKNTCLILLSHFILSHFTLMPSAVAKCHSLLFSFSKGCDQNGDRVSKNDEGCHICIR